MTDGLDGIALHPRPQLTRDRWTDLGGEWRFAYDDGDVGLDEGWPERPEPFERTIIVPFPPESRASGIGDPAPHPVVWYRRTFAVGPDEQGERLLLHFGAVDYRAMVWVNGRLVATHEGGQTPFSADITRALRRDGEQTLVVRAEDPTHDLALPRGKQDWQPAPHRIWYKRTTGIWQPVWLEPVPATRVLALRWTPDLERGHLGVHASVVAPGGRPLRLRVRLSLRGEPMEATEWTVMGSETRHALALDAGALAMSREQVLWSPRHPNLLDAAIDLLDGEEVVDTVTSYVGLRSCGVAHGRFLLNGRPFYPRLVLEQGYWPASHLAAPSANALRREAELVKELGFNGVRIHQKVEDPRFLHWCDRLGLLVWGEMANAYVFSPSAVERLTREWLEVLKRDYSHPCVVTWMPLNESWGVPNLERDEGQQAYVRALADLTRALDPTRPVIGNDGWEHLAGDIWGIHDYALDGATLRERYGTEEALARTLREVQPHYRPILLPGVERGDRPVMLTEFGGIADAPGSGDAWWGYGSAAGSKELRAKYEEVVGAVLDSPAIAGFCYTQLTDTEQERNGLLSAERVPKLDPAALRAITTRPAKAIPGDVIVDLQARSEAEMTAFQGAGE